MNTYKLPPSLLCFLVLLLWSQSAFASLDAQSIRHRKPPRFVEDEILIQFHEDHESHIKSKIKQRQSAIRETGLSDIDILIHKHKITELSHAYRKSLPPLPKGKKKRAALFKLKTPKGVDLREIMEELRTLPGVKHVQYNGLYTPAATPNDTYYASQYAHQLTDAAAGWDVEQGDASITIALIGTGIEWGHPDLAANIWSNTAETAGNGTDDDGNGYVDDVRGWNFYSNSNDPSPDLYNPSFTWYSLRGHETEAAGVAGAIGNNGAGVAGVAWNCQLMPLMVDFTSAQIAEAVDYASANGAHIINMSFGSYFPLPVEIAAINAAYSNGVTLIAAAGNDSSEYKFYPAALDNVIGVASTNSSDTLDTTSSYGAWVNVAAPGASVWTTTISSSYTTVSGTSYASPYVAGLAALLLSKEPSLTPMDIALRISSGAESLAISEKIGFGRVNINNALQISSLTSPSATLQSPANNESNTNISSIDITGIALGDSYTIEYKKIADSTWTTLSASTPTVSHILGTLDTSLLEPGDYDLRLSATTGATTVTDQITFNWYSPYQRNTGWPQVYNFSDGGGQEYKSSEGHPIYFDIDSDGDMEIFQGGTGSNIFGWHHDGTALQGWSTIDSGIYLSGTPAMANVDGTGGFEVLVPSRYYYFLVDSGRQSLTGWPQPSADLVANASNTFVNEAAVLSDLDNNGSMEIIITDETKAYVHTTNGSDASGWPVTLADTNYTSPTVGDLDNDGDMEIVIQSSGTLTVLHHTGTALSGWPISLDNSKKATPVLGDIDNDGNLEIITTGNTNVLYVFNSDGTTKFSVSLANMVSSRGKISLGDINQDRKPEIFVGDDIGQLYAIDHTGSTLSGWPVSIGPLDTLLSSLDYKGCAIADIDGDGQQEVLLSTLKGLLCAWNGDGSQLSGYCPKDMQLQDQYDYSFPAIGDLNGDGQLDLIYAGYTEATTFTLRESASDALLEWPMLRHNQQNTGLYSPNQSIPVISPILQLLLD